jgi:hypothetical protein
MTVNPRFSIIAVDYENHVSRSRMKDGLLSLANQTFKDFELIIVHDGPKNIPYEEEFDFNVFKNPPIFLNTLIRMDNWGHSSRDLGMRKANGEYFIHFNIDNIFYPEALTEIDNKIKENDSKIIIFTIIHHKINALKRGYTLSQYAEGWVPEDKRYLFTGLPPVYCGIDAMQLVAHRDIWENVDYWYDLHEKSDSLIYSKFCKEYSFEHIEKVLGENF